MGDRRRTSAERYEPARPSAARVLLRETFAAAASITLLGALGGPIALLALAAPLVRGRRRGPGATSAG